MTAKIEKVNPSTLPDVPFMGYSQITVAEGTKLIFMSGQVAWTAAGDPVPEDLTALGLTALVSKDLKVEIEVSAML